MPSSLKFLPLVLIAAVLASCEAPPPKRSATAPTAYGNHISNVRTTAYTHSEKGGPRNAIGTALSGRNIMSAASDWSRFPLGTRFKIVGSQDSYVIDDYGGALIGTNTIDLYKTSRLAMRQWGTRNVDIDVLEWGSKQHSLSVLGPRKNNRLVRRMIAGLQANKS